MNRYTFRAATVIMTMLAYWVAAAGLAYAATLTWTGGGDGYSWNAPDNWSPNQRPGYYDTLHITTEGQIGNVYRDSGTSLYEEGNTWRGTLHL